jgi:hypothetical protein
VAEEELLAMAVLRHHQVFLLVTKFRAEEVEVLLLFVIEVHKNFYKILINLQFSFV